MPLSVTNPFAPAWQRMLLLCFRPFNLPKWFALGFCAFLCQLGQQSFNPGFQNYLPSSPAPAPAPPPFAPPFAPAPFTPLPPTRPLNPLDQFTHWINLNFQLALLLGSAVLLFGIAVYLFLLWLHCRGRFMFIDNIAHNRALIKQPWKEFQPQAHSALLFFIILHLLTLIALLAAAAVCFVIALPDFQSQTFDGKGVLALLLALCLITPIVILSSFISGITTSFVMPLMYLRRQNISAAWHEFRTAVFPGNLGSIILYFLFTFILAIPAAIVAALGGCLTCCLGFLPYLSNVLTLPITTFFQAYPLYYLEQLGPDYKIIQDFTAPPTGFPVILDSPSFPPTPPPTEPTNESPWP